MKTFRSLGDLPTRMGMTTDEGGTVYSLPYGEGQLLATAVDDWRRIRLEPQLWTYGSRLQRVAGGAGTVNVFSLQARALPIRVIYIDVDNPVLPTPNGDVVKISRESAPTPLDGVGFGVALPLEGPGQGLDEPSARFVDHGSIAIGSAPISTNVGVGFVIKPTNTWFGHGAGRFLPRILLPGEALLFQNFTQNFVLSVQVAWEEMPVSSDVATSRAKEIGLSL